MITRRSKKVIWAHSMMIIFISAAIVQANDFSSVNIEEILSLGEDKQACLYQWAGVTVDSQSFIYVTDIIDYSIKKFDSNGHLLKTAGHKGEGHGEFTDIRLIDQHAGLIYVTEQSKSGIQVFDKDLHFVDFIDYQLPIIDIKIHPSGYIALSSFIIGRKSKLVLIDFSGRVIREIHLKNRTKLIHINGFVFDQENNFFIINKFADSIQKINSQGERIWEKRLFKDQKIKTKKLLGFLIPDKVFYKDIAIDTLGNLFVLGGEYSEHNSRDIYILDRDGHLITIVTLPEPTHDIYIDHKNCLYSRAKKGACLKKYNIYYK